MAFTLLARTRLVADSDWFSKLSKEEQEDYITDHPNSKFAVDSNKRVKEFNDKGDNERLDQLERQIEYLKDDIEEMEADGDDASQERAQLLKLRKEYKELRNDKTIL